MENTFVKDLWGKNPELVIKAIKKVCNIDEELAKSLSFERIDENGGLKFRAKYVFDYCDICVGDFYMGGTEYIDRGPVRTTRILSNSIGWMEFMYSVYGDKYAMQYITERNKKLDKYMAEYEENYNNQTRKVLAQMGFGNSKGQTK